jgi:NAD+ diphosphatase
MRRIGVGRGWAMRIAETVTFGGSGLDRAAHLRGGGADFEAVKRADGTRVLPVWRGKPLFCGTAPGWLAGDHAILADHGADLLFLGVDACGARFAQDISAWEPAPGEAVPGEGFFDGTEQRHPDLPADYRFAELRGVMTDLTPRDAELVVTGKALIGWHRSHRFCSACGQPSTVSQAGWQRTCGTCGTTHFPRTDPVVIMLITRGDSVLLGRAAAWPEGMFSLLAGFMEPGETIEAAVRREVLEETGVQVGAVRYLASQPWPYPSSLMIGCGGEALSATITPDPTEIEAAMWVPRAEMAAAFAGDHPVIRAPRNGAIAGFLLRNWLADRLD